MIILMAFAVVFLVLAGLGVPNPPRFQFGWWGMALWCIAEMWHGGIIPLLH